MTMTAREAMVALMNGDILRSEINGLRYRMNEKNILEVEVPNIGWKESFHGCINHMKRVRE